MSDGESEFLKYTCEFCGAEYHEYSKTRVWFLDSNGENPRWLTQTEIEKLHEREQKVEFTKTV
jgi:ribosomal protein L37AE/L43A